jgi:hypothetical protein
MWMASRLLGPSTSTSGDGCARGLVGALPEEEERATAMRMKDIKDVRDLREMNTNDVIELLDELRVIATKRGTELLGQGRHQARKAIGAPGEGAVTMWFLVGVLVGAATAAIATLLTSPMPGTEARRRLTEQMERVRERVPAGHAEGNGRSAYERAEPSEEVGTAGGSIASPSA